MHEALSSDCIVLDQHPVGIDPGQSILRRADSVSAVFPRSLSCRTGRKRHLGPVCIPAGREATPLGQAPTVPRITAPAWENVRAGPPDGVHRRAAVRADEWDAPRRARSTGAQRVRGLPSTTLAARSRSPALKRRQRPAGEGGPLRTVVRLRRDAEVRVVRWCYLRPVWIAFTSSPLAVSPLNSQKNAPRRFCPLAHAILAVMVAGVS